MLSQRIGFRFLDSGALYRAVAVFLYDQGLSLDTLSVTDFSEMVLAFDDHDRVMINGCDFEGRIRTAEVGVWASLVAAHPLVREHVISAGRFIIDGNNYVLEGRDTGTIWFPQADIKFFIVADPEVRAYRRWLDLSRSDSSLSLQTVLDQILDRDYRDSHRLDGPLMKPPGAYEIDTTHLTIEEQIDAIITVIRNAGFDIG